MEPSRADKAALTTPSQQIYERLTNRDTRENGVRERDRETERQRDRERERMRGRGGMGWQMNYPHLGFTWDWSRSGSERDNEGESIQGRGVVERWVYGYEYRR